MRDHLQPEASCFESMPQKTCADSASLDAMESASWHRKPSKSKKIRNSVSTSPGTDQFTRLGSSLVLCTAGFASVRSTISCYGVDCQNMQAFTPIASLVSPYRCNRTIRSWKERSGSSTCLIGLAVHEYHLTCVHIHILMNNEFQLWCSLRTTPRTRTTSRIRALEPDFVSAR